MLSFSGRPVVIADSAHNKPITVINASPDTHTANLFADIIHCSHSPHPFPEHPNVNSYFLDYLNVASPHHHCIATRSDASRSTLQSIVIKDSRDVVQCSVLSPLQTPLRSTFIVPYHEILPFLFTSSLSRDQVDCLSSVLGDWESKLCGFGPGRVKPMTLKMILVAP